MIGGERNPEADSSNSGWREAQSEAVQEGVTSRIRDGRGPGRLHRGSDLRTGPCSREKPLACRIKGNNVSEGFRVQAIAGM